MTPIWQRFRFHRVVQWSIHQQTTKSGYHWCWNQRISMPMWKTKARPQRQKNNKLLFKGMDEHEKWSKCEAETHRLGQGRLQGLVVGCRVTDLKKPLQFQASSSSQKRDVALLVLCSASCCRESGAGSVTSSNSQSVSKALKFKEKVQVCVYRSIISLVCCIEAVQARRLCQGCLMCSRVKVITQLQTEGQIY